MQRSAADPARRALAWLGGLAFVVSLGFAAYSYMVRFAAVPSGSSGAILRAVLADLALFSVFAVHHSLLARPRTKAWVVAHVPAPLERTIYVWISSALFVFVCAAWQPVPGHVYSLGGPWRAAGWLVQLAGVAITVASARVIDIWELSGIRQALGAERPPVFQAIGGYRFVRHPIYFGWMLMTFGTPEMTATRLCFAAISSAYLAIAIPFEERGLVAAFGEVYRAYARRVRWRLLPGIY